MRIALFLPTLAGGGAERVFINLARSIRPMVDSVQLVVGSKTGSYSNQVSDIDLVDLGTPRVGQSILPLSRYLASSQPDVLMSALPHANLAALAARALGRTNCRVVVSVHDDVLQRWMNSTLKEKLVLSATRWGYKYADGLIAVSNAGLRSVRSFAKDKLPVHVDSIYNPVLGPTFSVQPLRIPINTKGDDRIYRIVSAGRLTPEKDFGTLIKAFSKIRMRRKATLIIYGEGPMREQLCRYAAELGVGQDVHLPGFVENLGNEFQNADVFVLTSLWEGFGNVLIEALASGCPVVSTDCPGGPREILGEGRFGHLAPVRDYEAIGKAVEDTLEGRYPVFDTTSMVSQFRTEFIARKYVQFLHRVMQ